MGQLILYIIYQVDDLGGYTITIRLVKFLYLIDLEHYRCYGKTLTGLDWIYHNYGPYAFALPQIGQRLGFDLEREEFSMGGKKGTLLHTSHPYSTLKDSSFVVESTIQRILEVWADQDTSVLLDYVYHRTEPMIKAIRGQRLDFSTTRRGTGYYELCIKAEAKRVKQLKESIMSYQLDDKDEFTTIQTTKDDVFKKGLTSLYQFEQSVVCGNIQPITNENFRDTLPNED